MARQEKAGMTKSSTALVLGICMFVAGAPCLSERPSDQRVTIETHKGEAVEGTLRELTAGEVVVEVAGQSIHLNLSSIRYISFIGRIPGAAASAPMSTLEKAIQAFNNLKSVTQTGVLRDQYSQFLVENIPPIREFIEESSSDWPSVKLAMRIAMGLYRRPMESIEAWSYASGTISGATSCADYALHLASNPQELSHTESQVEPVVEFGETSRTASFRGRLGAGDRSMPLTLDQRSAGGLNDVFTIKLLAPGTLSIELAREGDACFIPSLLLADHRGTRVKKGTDDLSDISNVRSRINRSLSAGEYKLWAGALPSQVGSYRLLVSFVRR